MTTIKQIVFTKPYVAEYKTLNETDFSDIGEKEVVVKTMVSTISGGTERANFTGEKEVTVIPNMEVPFPRTVGYSSSGEVVKVGCKVTKVKIGDRVAMFWSKHKNYNVLSEENVVKIPDEKITFEEAAISFIATFPLAAIRKVKLEIGESIMVMGLGVLGQLAVILAKSAGAYPVIACDIVESRRKEALKNGADYAFNPLDEHFIDNVNAVAYGGVKTAIEVTGVGDGLNQTLDCMARHGRIALLGCTRNSDFSIDYYHKVHGKGVMLIGAHTNARPEKESYPSYFTHEEDIKTILNLCKGERISIKKLIKETCLPNECQKVFDRLANEKEFPICVQFDWRNE